MSEDIWIIAMRNFEDAAIRSPLPVMLAFWSAQYPSCQRLIETMETLAARYRGSIRFGLVDVDDQSELARQLGIGGLPCVLVLNGGRLCANIGGELPLSHYKRLLDRMLSDMASEKKKQQKLKEC